MHDFELLVARHQHHLLELLAENPDARLVAGATDFIPLIGMGKWTCRVAIDISRLDELHGIQVEDSWLRMGPLTTHAEAASFHLIRERLTALAEACASVADPLIRARATLGGNLCTASPAADSVPALFALGAELYLKSLNTERRLPVSDFLTGPGKTGLKPGEMLAAVYLPLPVANGAGSAFVKLGKRQAMAISVANAAAWVQVQNGSITSARVALGSVAPTVVYSRSAEAALKGMLLDRLSAADGAETAWAAAVRADISPIDDVRASGAYRRTVSAALAQRAVEQACERAK